MRTPIRGGIAWVLASASILLPAGSLRAGPLDPRGRIHVPIGIPDSLDALKTFVESEGNFSPGFATYGIGFWVLDRMRGVLLAPTMEGVACERGLSGGGRLIPWTAWRAGELAVRTEVCHVRRPSPAGEVHVASARVRLENRGRTDRPVRLYAALRPLGPAGGAVRRIAVAGGGDALLVEGHPALVAAARPSGAGVAPDDAVGDLALAGRGPDAREAVSAKGDASGALWFDRVIPAGGAATLGFTCPVLAGRRAVRHRWDGVSTWAQLDLAEPLPAEGGVLQPDPGLAYYRGLDPGALFAEAEVYWDAFAGRVRIRTPDPRWRACFAALAGHIALCMNEGALDVAVVNYNVFNRDGVLSAGVLQKSGHLELAARAIDRFLAHPFSGRVYPEADNPGQILWILGEHWRIARDRTWLDRVYPAVRKLAALIRYGRSTPPPHWVSMDRLAFGDEVPAEERRELVPGRCDGHHPEYTEAYDVAGLRAAVLLAEARGQAADAAGWRALAGSLMAAYDRAYGARPARGYGSYCVLWPCRVYPPGSDRARRAFGSIGARRPGGWRYFPLATAHQGLLAGRREAGWGTIDAYLEHEPMRGWYVLDEGGRSGPGGWRFARTTWEAGVAMPHGWAVAELFLLLRDCLLFEEGGTLVLLAGIPAAWFRHPGGIAVENLPTHFGPCSFTYAPDGRGATLAIAGRADPPEGFLLRLPPSLEARVEVDGRPAARAAGGAFRLPRGTRRARIGFGEGRRPGRGGTGRTPGRDQLEKIPRSPTSSVCVRPDWRQWTAMTFSPSCRKRDGFPSAGSWR